MEHFQPADRSTGVPAGRIAVFVNQLGNDYQLAFCRSADEEARRLGYPLLFFNTELNHRMEEAQDHLQAEQIFSLPDAQQFDGLLVVPNSFPFVDDSAHLERMTLPFAGVPIVALDRPIGDAAIIRSVGNDSAEEIVRHLVRDHGYTRINHIAGPQDNRDGLLRLGAYRRVLEEFGIPYEAERVYVGGFDREQGAMAVRYFLASGLPLPQAIVAANDDMAASAYAELLRHGLSVPGDVALTGYDCANIPLCEALGLTSVATPIAWEGSEAIRLLHRLRMGEVDACTEPLQSRVALRTSCGCPRQDDGRRDPIAGHLLLQWETGNTQSIVSAGMFELAAEELSFQSRRDKLLSLVRKLGLRRFFLCLRASDAVDAVPDPCRTPVSLVLGYSHGTVYEETTFNAVDLLPAALAHELHSLVFCPLYYNECSYGYLAVDLADASPYLLGTWCQEIRLLLEGQRIRTLLQRYASAMDEMNKLDPLTNVLNRRGLEHYAPTIMANRAAGHLLYVLYFDLDNLKGINDTFGHSAGDDIICTLASALKQCAQPNDIIARMGGDEFLIFGTIESEAALRSRIFSIQSWLALHNEHTSKPYEVKVSTGWYLQGQGCDSLKEMIEMADAHLYEARRNARSTRS